MLTVKSLKKPKDKHWQWSTKHHKENKKLSNTHPPKKKSSQKRKWTQVVGRCK